MTFFDHLWDGKHMNYDHSFSMQVAKVQNVIDKITSLVAVSLFLLNIILSVIIHFLLKPSKKKTGIQEGQFKAVNMTESFFEAEKEEQIPLLPKILETINIVLWLLVVGEIAIIGIAYSVYGIIPGWLSGLLFLFFGTIGILVQIWRHSLYFKKISFKRRVKDAFKYFKWLLLFEGFVFVFFSVFLPFAFQKGCLCVYSSGYGIETFLDLYFSTKWTRGNWLPDKVCPNNQICHIYATLPENTDTEVFINIHSGIDINQLDVILSNENEQDINIKCQQIPFPKKIEDRGQRNVFTCYAQDLNPFTSYNVDIKYKDQIVNQTTYKTFAQKDSQDDVTILFGGDWGYQDNGLLIVDQISKVNPDAILIGGDIAYDNGNVNCYYSFDLLLTVFEKQFNTLNRIIPFIFSVGNHDVGFNDYADYNITVSDEDGPLYFTYFPQKAIQNQIVPIKDRITYNLHRIQNLLIFGLDSGYLHFHNGTQKDWMISILDDDNSNDYYKFAHYHVPIYPTCYNNQSFMGKWSNVIKAREAWVPIFDEYEFTGAFENHVHQYKRSYPLKNSKKSDKGTVYFGDGSMGIRTVDCPLAQQTYTEGKPFEGLFETVKTSKSDHFWVLYSNGEKKTIDFNAFQPDYTIIPDSNYVVTPNQQQKHDL